MKTSPITFEQELRRRLLDVVYGQWRDLGVPFAAGLRAAEVIDPEALLWCSLEFLPTEPRLCEGVLAWLDAHGNELIRQRLSKHAVADEPRSAIWRAMAGTRDTNHESFEALCHGLQSPEELAAFCERLRSQHAGGTAPSRLGLPGSGASTALVRARRLLGGDLRHFLLIYLLANPGGGRLRTVQKWAGYSYRSIAETAGRWEAAQAATIDHGHCRLSNPGAWRELLHLGHASLVVVDWFVLFEACIHLLRAAARAARKNIPADSPILAAFQRDAAAVLTASLLNGQQDEHGAVPFLGELFIPKDTRPARPSSAGEPGERSGARAATSRPY